MSSVSGCIMVGFKIGYAVATALKNLKIGYQIAENELKRVKKLCMYYKMSLQLLFGPTDNKYTKYIYFYPYSPLQNNPNSYFH